MKTNDGGVKLTPSSHDVDSITKQCGNAQYISKQVTCIQVLLLA